MYKKGDLTVSLEEAQESANFANISIEEWAEQYGWTLEGKATVPTDTTPPTEPVKETAAGDSSLVDTSLE